MRWKITIVDIFRLSLRDKFKLIVFRNK